MLDTGLDREQEYLRRTVEDFAKNVVAPVSAMHDSTATFPYDVVRQMFDIGLFGLPFPEQYGGMGGDVFVLCLAIEELARVDQSVAVTLEAGCSLGAMPIFRFGTESQKEQWLPQLTSGGALAAFGLTESSAGSDAGGIRTTARLEDGQWVLNGSKSFITNSGTELTKLVTVAALSESEAAGSNAISTILVPVPSAGLVVGEPYDKVGWHASDTHPLYFDDLRVPEANLIGERGRGYRNFLEILGEGRIAIAALGVGAAQGCVDESVRYAHERETFGHPLSSNQVIAFNIAEMEARAHTARCAYYDAAARMLKGRPFKKEAAIAKLVASGPSLI